MSAMCKERKQRFSAHLGVENYAVGVKCAFKKIACALRLLSKCVPDHAFMEFDAVAAFCSMHREDMLAELASCSPEMIALEAQWLTRETKVVLFTQDGNAEVLRSTVGADQGCSASPVAYAMGMRRVLDRLQVRMRVLLAQHPGAPDQRELHRLVGFLDDLLVVVPRRHASEVARLVEGAFAEAGLSINWSKSQVWCPDGAALPADMPMPVAKGGLVMCGAPTLAAALTEEDDLDWEHTCPIGADEFVEGWLD
eukprot:9456911-Karenia_brevis.AAC.2